MEQTEHWIRPSQGRRAIALIHGIGAKDPQAYWQDFISVLTHDEELQEFGVFVWKYPTHRQPGGIRNVFSTVKEKTLRETAPWIAELGSAWDTTYREQFQGYQDVALVCHSMGGLVVKSWILDRLEQGRSTSLVTLRHIAFYATPNQGAPITTLAQWNKQLKDMQLGSPFIEEVDRRWYDHVVAWKEHVPEPAYEHFNRYIPHLVVAGINDAVVPSHYATIRGMPLTAVAGDHSQVIQPINSNDTRYKIWRTHLDEAFKMILPSTDVALPLEQPTRYVRGQQKNQIEKQKAFAFNIGFDIFAVLTSDAPDRRVQTIEEIKSRLAYLGITVDITEEIFLRTREDGGTSLWEVIARILAELRIRYGDGIASHFVLPVNVFKAFTDPPVQSIDSFKDALRHIDLPPELASEIHDIDQAYTKTLYDDSRLLDWINKVHEHFLETD